MHQPILCRDGFLTGTDALVMPYIVSFDHQSGLAIRKSFAASGT